MERGRIGNHVPLLRGLLRDPVWWCVALVVVHAGLLVWAGRTNSVTFDEYAHLPAGVAYWRYGDFSIYDQSPPLLRMVGAAPAVVAGAEAPPVGEVDRLDVKDRHWRYGRLFLNANRGRYAALFVWGRLAMVPVSCLGLWLVYRWAGQLYGRWAGVGAGALYAFSPNVLAHGSLVTTDVGTMVLMAGGVWAWWRFCRKPDVRRGAGAAGVIAVAQLCKFTSLLLFPTVGVIAVWYLWAGGWGRWRRLAVGLVAVGVGSVVVINAAYLFRGSGRTIGSYAFRSRTMTAVQRVVPAGVRVPLPADYVEGFDAQKWEAEGLYAGFILGEKFTGTRWYYYPVAVLVKTPCGVLGLAVLAGGVAVVSVWRRRGRWREGEVVVGIALVIFIAGMAGLVGINIGLRYLMPAFPLAYVLISRVWTAGRGGNEWVRRVGWGLVGVAVVEGFVVAPDYLSFVNVLGGGPTGGWRVVNDSNFDWGQDLVRLKEWMDRNDVGRVHLGYFGRVDPSVYGIDYVPLDRPSGEPVVVVSTFFLAGMESRLPTREGPTGWVGIPFHKELAEERPLGVAGRTLYIYDRAAVADAMRRYRMSQGQ